MELAGEVSNRDGPAQLEYLGTKNASHSLIDIGSISDRVQLIHTHKLWFRFL